MHALSMYRVHFLYQFYSVHNQICQRSGQILFVLYVCYLGISFIHHDRANVSVPFPWQSNCSRLWRTLHKHDVPIFWYFNSPKQYTLVLDVFVSIYIHISVTDCAAYSDTLFDSPFAQILHNPRSLQYVLLAIIVYFCRYNQGSKTQEIASFDSRY